MTTFNDILGGVDGGRLLDVATGTGGFVRTLCDSLRSFDEITGVDNSEKSAREFPKAFEDARIHFQAMDAMQLDFPEASFDTVSISFSLHHLPEPRTVLREMMRVLRPGGRLIAAEMYRDGQTETQMSHVLLHHWWAAVDRARGVYHNETHTRAEIVGMIEALGLEGLEIHDLNDMPEDPHDPETLSYLENTIDQYLAHLASLGGDEALRQQGEALRERLRVTGFHGAEVLVVVGRKR